MPKTISKEFKGEKIEIFIGTNILEEAMILPAKVQWKAV